ncbi:MAG: imelysin [Bacteroidaceae bacterium]|nr:imelysin [Bacteroidaceae bacterium]
MKKILKYAMLFASVIALGTSFLACSDDDDKNEGKLSEKQTAMKELTEQYVNNVIYPIYSSLANQTSVLFEQLVDAKKKYRAGSLNQSDIDKICATFINARSAWEQSESFLYGAATDWGIDPHIDTWPLDRVALAKQLSSSEIVEELDDLDEGGIDNARALVGEQQLGFHGIEFIIFRNGKNRTLAALKGIEDDEAFAGRNISGEQELVFACAVAGDLRDKCYQLEVSWMGSKAPKEHQDRVEECEFNTTVAGGDLYYGENMINATQAGSTMKSWRGVMGTILVSGCSNICAEVAGQKIGQAYLGQDEDYIESPYSQRSYYDFYDNISSIKYSLYGQQSDEVHAKSIMAYLQKYNSSMANELSSKLNAALKALDTAKKGTPFVVEPHSNNAKAAMDAINALDETLNSAASWIAAN